SIFVLGLLPWAAIFMFSFFLFDAPGSGSSPLTVGLFYAIASYPLLVIAGFLASGGFWRARDDRHWRRFLAFLPLISPVAAVVFLLAINALCRGQFSCRA